MGLQVNQEIEFECTVMFVDVCFALFVFCFVSFCLLVYSVLLLVRFVL